MRVSELTRLLAATGADVRLAVVDGCNCWNRPGESESPGFEVVLAEDFMGAGEATLISTTSELATFESDEIGSSPFTYHMVWGLRGAADRSGDLEITLAEAYSYALERLAPATAGAAPEPPGGVSEHSAGGSLVLTRLTPRTRTRAARTPESPSTSTSEREPGTEPGPGAEPGSPEEREAAYEKSYLHFGLGTPAVGAGVATSYRVYRGRFAQVVGAEDFYRIVGRQDLADKYRGRKKTRRNMFIGSVALVAGVVVSELLRRDCSGEGSSIQEALDDLNSCRTRFRVASVVMGLGGVGLGVGGLVLEPHPVSKAEVRELADSYNRGLRSRLGLAEGVARRPAEPRLRLELFVDRGGGGLAF